MKYFIINIICLSIVISCTSKNESASNLNLPHVPVDITKALSYNYLDIVDSTCLSYIQLETKPESLIGVIDRLYVKDGYIFCISNNRLIVFSESGKYIYSIRNKGKGPDEYLALNDVRLENDTLYLLDRIGKKVIKYLVNGKFIESIHTGLHSSSFVIMNDRSYCFYVNSERTKKSEYRLNYFSGSNRRLYYSKDRITDKEYKWRYFLSINYFFAKKDTFLVNYPCNDTIYRLSDNNVEPYYFIDWGKYSLPIGAIHGNYKDVEDFYNTLGKDRIYYTLGIFSSDTHLSFGFRLKDKLYQVLYNWETKKSKIISAVNDPYYLTGKSQINFSLLPKACDNRFFYVSIEQSDFTNMLKKQGDISEEFINTDISRNPVIAKIKYK